MYQYQENIQMFIAPNYMHVLNLFIHQEKYLMFEVDALRNKEVKGNFLR